jgi:hypothetical protein
MWFLAYLAAFLIATFLVHYYAEQRTHFGVSLLVGFSWALGFSYFLVLPFDIAGAFCRACGGDLHPALGGGVGATATTGANDDDVFLPEASPPSTPGLGGAVPANECACFPSVGLEMLSDIIPVCYGLTMLNGYLMNDLLRSYLDSGEFTRRGRFKDAGKDAAIFYVPALLLGLVFVVYMVVHDGLTFDGIRALGRGFINAIGLFLLIAFLGYGFVEVPRDLFNKANTEGLLRYFKFRVAVQSEELQHARRKLEETLEVVHSTDANLRGQPHSVLHEHMAAILRKCPRAGGHSTSTGGGNGSGSGNGGHSTEPMRPACGDSSTPPSPPPAMTQAADAESGRAGRFGTSRGRGGGGGGEGSGDEKLLPSTRSGLVALNLRLKRALAQERRSRSMYELSVREALRHQSLFQPEPEHALPGGRLGGGTGLSTLSQLAYTPTLLPQHRRWHGEIKPWLYKGAAVGCGLLSVTIIWCEGTILFDDPPFNLNLSPLSYLFRWLGSSGGGFFSILMLYVPLLYCAFCTYFAMFQMRLLEGMTLYPNKHSDPSSLLFNATYACRLGPPLCFNFLKLLHEKDPRGLFVSRAGSGAGGGGAGGGPASSTYFTMTSFGNMDQIPFFSGDYFNNYAPLMIVLIAGCTLLNLGSGLLSCCAKCCPCVAAPTFSFDEDFSDARIDHGAQILLHEKRALADGVPLGANLQLLSGATSDSEEQTRMRGGGAARPTPSRSRFRRLNDDAL